MLPEFDGAQIKKLATVNDYMRIIKVDYRANFFEAVPDNLDDLWHLEKIIEPGDIVSGTTERKIKPKEEGMKQSKETIFIELQAEKIEFHESSGDLRIQGIIVFCPSALVEIKSHHTLEVFPGKQVKVKKEQLKKYQVDRLEKAKIASGRDTTVLVVLDDEEAEIVLLKDFSFEKKARILAGKSGKMFKSADTRGIFFEKIAAKLNEIAPKKVIFAGPGFTKAHMEKYLQEKKPKYRPFFEQINSVGITGINEAIKSGVVEKVVAETQLVKETKLVEKILEELGKQRGLAAIDLKEIKQAIAIGAIEHLLVTDDYLLSNRAETEKILDEAEKLKGEIHILSTKTDSGKKLKGFGGIAAILRFNAT